MVITNKNKNEILKQRKEYNRKYSQNNKERIAKMKRQNYLKKRVKISESSRKYYQDNRGIIIKRVAQYRQKNKKKIREGKKISYLKNKDKVAMKNKVYYIRNTEKISERSRQYYLANKEEIAVKRNTYQRKLRKTNPVFRIKHLLRCRLREALTNYSKNGKTKLSDEYDINYCKIIEHLTPFPKEMSQYHIDHIKPLCSFDFNDPEQIRIAFAPENHQWLTIKKNLSKGGKIL